MLKAQEFVECRRWTIPTTAGWNSVGRSSPADPHRFVPTIEFSSGSILAGIAENLKRSVRRPVRLGCRVGGQAVFFQRLSPVSELFYFSGIQIPGGTNPNLKIHVWTNCSGFSQSLLKEICPK